MLLLVIAIAAPWVVQLAPPRHRPLALIGVIAVLLFYWIFSRDPLASWALWVGLAVAIGSIVLAKRGRSLPGAGGRRPRRPRRGRGPGSGHRLPDPFDADPDGSQPTGEI